MSKEEMLNYLEVKKNFAKQEADMYNEEYVNAMKKCNLDRANSIWKCYIQSYAVYKELCDIVEYLKGLEHGKGTNK